MARRIGRHFVGKVGTINTRLYRGMEVMQSNPGRGKVKQTANTKKAAGIFGKSSALAATFRTGLKPVINGNYDGEMISTFTGMMRTIVQQCYNVENSTFNFEKDDFNSLVGFDFNKRSPLLKNMWIAPTAELSNNILRITIPALKIGDDLKFPERTNLCKIKVVMGIYNLTEGYLHNYTPIQLINVNAEDDIVESQHLDFDVPAGCVCFAGIGLNYYTLAQNIAHQANNKDFNPAAICGVFVNDGEWEMGRVADWTRVQKAVFK
jgi:hypothetical protein